MSVNVFEVIVKKEINPYDKIYIDNPINNAFNDFSFSKTLNQEIPSFYSLSGFSVIQNLLANAIANSDFTAAFAFEEESIDGNQILSSFQRPSAWILRRFSIDNHGLSQDKSELSEESTSNGYDYYTGSERIIPKLFLNSQTSSYEGAEILSANSTTGTFTNGDLTGWALIGTNSTDGVADYAWVTTAGNFIGVQKSFLGTDVFEENAVYELSFERIASTTSMRCSVSCGANFNTSFSSTAGVEKLYFTAYSTDVLINFQSSSSSQVIKFDNVTIKKIFEAERVGDTDSFAYLPDPSSEKGFAQPNHRYSLSPDKIIDFGCFQTYNVFQSGWEVRSNTVEGVFGNSSRHIKYEHSDYGIIEGKYYTQYFEDRWYYNSIFVKQKDYESGNGNVVVPTLLRLKDVFNPLDIGRTVKFTANLTFDQGSGVSDEIIGNAYPSFNSAGAIASELITNNQFFNGSTGFILGSDWTVSNGQAFYSGDTTTSSLSTSVGTVSAGKTYALFIQGSAGEDTEMEVYINLNSPSSAVKVEFNKHMYITMKDGATGTGALVIQRKSGLTPTAYIDSISFKDTSKAQMNNPSKSGNLNENPFFSQGSYGWVKTDTASISFDETNKDATITIVNGSLGDNRFRSEESVMQPGRDYEVTYEVKESSVTTFQFYDGTSYFDIPHNVGIHKFTITNSSAASSKILLNAKHATADPSNKIVLNSVIVKEVYPLDEYYKIDLSNNRFALEGTFEGVLNSNLYTVKLDAGQDYRVQLDVAELTHVKNAAFFVQEQGGGVYVYSQIDELGKAAFNFQTSKNDSGSVIVILKLNVAFIDNSFSSSAGSARRVSLNSIRFAKNTVSHEHILKGCPNGAIKSESDFIITSSDLSAYNGEGLIEEHYIANDNTLKIHRVGNPDPTFGAPSEDAKSVVSKREYCNPFYNGEGKYLDEETYKINPSLDCPVDSDGFYTGASVDFTTEIKIGSPHLNFFADNLSTNNVLRTTAKLNSLTFHTCEDAYITKDPTTANALKIHYDDSSSTRPPEAITSIKLPSNLYNSEAEVTLNWDVQSLTGAFAIDFDNDDGNSVIVSSSGTGSQSVKVDGHTIRVRPIKGNESNSVGSELLSNNTFSSTSNWTLGGAWSIAGGKAVITEPTFITTTGFTYARLGLRQDSVLTAGDTYRIEINVAATNGKALSIVLGAADDLINETNLVYTEEFSVGTHTIEAVAGGTDFLILADLPFIGEINSVSVKKLTPAASKSVDAVINSLGFTQSGTDAEIRSMKWGDEATMNNGVGKGILPNTAGLRVYSATPNSETLANTSSKATISTTIGSTAAKDKVKLTLYVNYVNTNNTISVKHNLTDPSITTTETITSAVGAISYEYNNTSIDTGSGFDDRFIDVEFESDGSNPLDCVISYISVQITESAQDSQTIHLDLYDDFTLPINLIKKDYKNLGSINGDYTKSIKVPATSNNKLAVDFSNELTSFISSSQKNGFEAIVKSGGVKVFEGLLFLSETTFNENGSQDLILNMRSGNSNWAERLKNKRLRTLQSSNYSINIFGVTGVLEETLTSQVFEGDHSSQQRLFYRNNDDIFFPLIDNGKLYEDIDGNRLVSWDNIKPAYKILPIIEKMFSEIGYTLDSDFLNLNNEWDSDFSESFSAYRQNLVGIAPSFSFSEEEIGDSEIDLSYSSADTSSSAHSGYNDYYDGVEPSYFSISSKSNPRPRLKSIFKNKGENDPQDAYFCDWAFLRFTKVNKDLNDTHSYSNLNTLSPRIQSVFIPKDESSRPNKVTGYVSPQKSNIKVSKSGYYEINANIILNITLSTSTGGVAGIPDGEAVTLCFIPEQVSYNHNDTPYLDNNSFGTEAFDLTETSSVEMIQTRMKLSSYKLNVSKVQFLKKDVNYQIVVIHGSPHSYDFSGVIPNKEFKVLSCELNVKLSKDPAPLKGKETLIYNGSAAPIANYANTLPDVTCLEFATEISKTFNLVWDVNETTKTVTVEPFSDFYKFEGSRRALNQVPSLQQSWEDYASLSDFIGVQCTVTNGTAGSGVVMTPVASPTIAPVLVYSTPVPTTYGNVYSYQFDYNTFRRFRIRLGSVAGGKDMYVSQWIESSPDAGDISNQAGTHTFKVASRGDEVYISFEIKDGKNLGGESFNTLRINNIIVTGIEDTYVDWTDKALIKNSQEHYVIKSDTHFKMKDDSNDYLTSKISSGSSGVRFGDRLIESGLKTGAEAKNYELNIFSSLRMANSKYVIENDSVYLPRIWSKPKNDSEVFTFDDLPDPNNEHEHKLAVLGGVIKVPNNPNKVSYSLGWVYDYSRKRLGRQIVKVLYYNSVYSYSDFESNIPNLTFGKTNGLSVDKSLYEEFHSSLIEMFKFRDKMVTAEVSLSYSDLNDINFRDIIHIDGNIYILNKVKDFNFSGEPTEVELLLVTLTK